jgi:hypothetical protein
MTGDSFWSVVSVGLSGLAVSWALGSGCARHRAASLLARTLGSIWTLLVAFVYFGSVHRAPPELVMLAAMGYPLIACEKGRAWGRRALVLAGLCANTVAEAWDLLHWRYGWAFPDAARYCIAGSLFIGVPLIGVAGAIAGYRRRATATAPRTTV